MGLLDPGSKARGYLRNALGAGLAAAVRLRGARAEARIIYYHRIDDEMHRSCVSPARLAIISLTTRRVFRRTQVFVPTLTVVISPYRACATS